MEIKRAVIEIQGSCNYSCSMCLQPNRPKAFLEKIPLGIYEGLIDQCVDLGVEVVQLDGSGECTLNKDLPLYIQYAASKNIKTQIFSNGFLMSDFLMEDCVDAGLDLFRFSVIGYDEKSFMKMTNTNNFNVILENCIKMKEYIEKSDAKTEVLSYHLIIDDVSEVELYRKNFIDVAQTQAEIWKQHNWSGMIDVKTRSGVKKTCGRPFAPEITIRAGGINGHRLAVHPCCQTLGRDEEAVLSHCDNQSILEAFNSERYNWLREKHFQGDFDDVSFCKDCDFLYDDDSVLVWSNIPNKQRNKMIGLDFVLERQKHDLIC